MNKPTHITIHFEDGMFQWTQEGGVCWIEDTPGTNPQPVPPPVTDVVEPGPPPMGLRRVGTKLIDKATGNPRVLNGFGKYNLLSDATEGPAKAMRALHEIIGSPGVRTDKIFRVFSTLPYGGQPWEEERKHFVHPEWNHGGDDWSTRCQNWIKECRDLGWYSQLCLFDEPERVRRERTGDMPSKLNTWGGREQVPEVAFDLWNKWYKAGVPAYSNVILEIANEAETRWMDRREMRGINEWLKKKVANPTATSWGGGKNYEGADLLWLHWSPRYAASRSGLDRLIEDCVEHRDLTGNPVGLSTDGKGLDEISSDLIVYLGEECRKEGLHCEVMLALRNGRMPALYRLDPWMKERIWTFWEAATG